MEVKILDLRQITKENAYFELKTLNSSESDKIDEYLDILSVINNGQLVYRVTTSIGEFVLYVTAKETNI